MTKIIGILNYNQNSFSDGGVYINLESAKKRVEEMFDEGADIVDIGCAATSYGVDLIDSKKELDELLPLLKSLESLQNISVDTYNYETMRVCADIGVRYINDVSGGANSKIWKLLNENTGIKYICMYSTKLPADHNVRVRSVQDVYDWFKSIIKKADSYGITNDSIVLDPGIGFSTNSEQSLDVIKNIKILRDFGVKVCIGHSRKSFLNLIKKLAPRDRDVETLAASLYMYNKVDYLRVHNVSLHKRAFDVYKELYV